MMLKGIYAPPGTLIGVHKRDQRFLVADVCDTSDLEIQRLPVRWATDEEVKPETLVGRIPRSVVEHAAIPLRQTPYGKARVIPTGTTMLEFPMPGKREIEKEIRKILRSVGLRKK